MLVSLISCTNTSETIKDVPVDTSSPSESTSDTENNTKMSFFITSANPWNGANLWWVEGADAYCQSLAESVWAGDKTWRAYLSTTPMWMSVWMHARDRIGIGPWYNAKGVLIASSVEELHSSANNLNKQTALTEKGDTIMGRGDEVNLHDVLTGSNPDGTASWSLVDTTCVNWTASWSGSAIVGHHDRMGLNDSDAAKSWNSSHPSRWCSMENLKSTGGAWLFYCFAVTWE